MKNSSFSIHDKTEINNLNKLYGEYVTIIELVEERKKTNG